jgi:acetyl-CoA synthetase
MTTPNLPTGQSRPAYRDFARDFSWDNLIGYCDWPAREKYNFAHELCDRWANDPAKADQPALRYETKDGKAGTYTYRELKEMSNRWANVLTSLGVQKGDRVGGLLPKVPAILPVVLGVWKVGAVYVPLFTAFAAPAVAYRLRHSDTSVIVTDESQLPKIVEGRQSVEGLGNLRHVVVVRPEGSAPPDDSTVDFWSACAKASPEFKVVETTLDDLLEIQYTSGSTGNPKGAMIPHKLGFALLPYVLYAMDLRPEDVFWGGADPGWAYGLIICLLGPLMIGNTATLIEPTFNPELCWQVMARYGVTNFAYAPTAYRALAAGGSELLAKYKADIKLRVASSAGEPLNPEVIEWFSRELNVPVYDHYGQSELLMIVNNYHAFSDPVKFGSMGRPTPGFEVEIVDENGNPATNNSIGQIALNRHGFAYVFKGYWQDAEKTAASYLNQWHLTGDLARRDDDGYFWFEGRSDDLINTSGYRVGPFEIESALIEHPAVTEAAVIAVPDAQRGEVIRAYVTLMPGQSGSPELTEALQQIVREKVGKHAFPRQVEYVEALPKTPSGKIQRFLLRKEASKKDA